MWFMPSYGRPEALRTMLDAPGGWPPGVMVLINRDDPEAYRYQDVIDELVGEGRKVPWVLAPVPAGSRCADAHRYITEKSPNLPWYGLLCDDHWPITPGWHEELVREAGSTGISTPAGEPLFPKLRNAVVLGGDLVRAMGSLVPAPVRHNYEDNLWDQIAADFDILKPRADLIVEHRHWIRGEASKDATYVRGSSDIDQDRVIFEEWLRSPDRVQMNERIAKLLGVTVSTFDSKAIKLLIVAPLSHVDPAYHKSLVHTMIALTQAGIPHKVIENMGGSHVGKAREGLLWGAWKEKPTHILWIDDDMGWQPRQVTRLLAADHEFSCIAGVKKQDKMAVCANFYRQPEFHPRTKFLKIRDVGFAFVLLKASVIEKMCAAYPELEYNAGDAREFALFLDMIDKGDTEHGVKGERLSEDFAFTRRWTAIGGEIWCDASQAIIHAGRKEYTGKVSDLFEYEKPQAIAAE